MAYPMLDDRTTLSTDHGGRGKVLWSPKSNRFAWTAYLGREPRIADAPEYAAPSRREDVAGLAPAWIGVGDIDLFYEEGVRYADKLQACGVPCELVTVPRMYHGADGLVPGDSSMRRFQEGMVNHLRTYLTTTR
jgi:acetyl esterase/lipase